MTTLAGVLFLFAIAAKNLLPAASFTKLIDKEISAQADNEAEGKTINNSLLFETLLSYQSNFGLSNLAWFMPVIHFTSYQNNYITANYQAVQLQPPKGFIAC